MPAIPLDDRREVLRALIQLHVDTGEPVGSENLSRALRRALSPATLRSIMADLEALGYLDHPHTSAGRVPTDEGYRVYVDSLTGPRPLLPGEAERIESELGSPDASAEQTMARASHLLSRLSRNVGFVLAPDIARASFRHVDLVPLGHPRILVVMVSSTGIVTHKVIEVEERLSPSDLQACANYLNAHFAGMTLAEIRTRLLELMKEEKAHYDSLLQNVVALGERAFSVSEGEERLPRRHLEHARAARARRRRAHARPLRTFEEKSRLVRILNACIAGDGIRVLIGHENPDPDLRDISLVTATCRVEGEPGLGVGVLGSTAMEYAHVYNLLGGRRGPGGVGDPAGQSRRLSTKGNGNDEETFRSPPRRRPGRRRSPRPPQRSPGRRGSALRAPPPTRSGAAPGARRPQGRAPAPPGRGRELPPPRSSAIAAPPRPRRRSGSWRQLLGTVDNLERVLAAGGADRRGGRPADAARAAGPARLARRHRPRPPRGRGCTRPSTRRSCTSRPPASRRDGGGGLPEGVHVQGPAAPARPRQGRERRVAGGRGRRRGRAVTARRERSEVHSGKMIGIDLGTTSTRAWR